MARLVKRPSVVVAIVSLRPNFVQRASVDANPALQRPGPRHRTRNVVLRPFVALRSSSKYQVVAGRPLVFLGRRHGEEIFQGVLDLFVNPKSWEALAILSQSQLINSASSDSYHFDRYGKRCSRPLRLGHLLTLTLRLALEPVDESDHISTSLKRVEL